MLLDAGFGRVTRFERVDHQHLVLDRPAERRAATGVVDKVRRRVEQRFGRARSGRMVFHAHV